MFKSITNPVRAFFYRISGADKRIKSLERDLEREVKSHSETRSYDATFRQSLTENVQHLRDRVKELETGVYSQHNDDVAVVLMEFRSIERLMSYSEATETFLPATVLGCFTPTGIQDWVIFCSEKKHKELLAEFRRVHNISVTEDDPSLAASTSL